MRAIDEFWYDYDLQVWVRGTIIQDCGHPNGMRPDCCNGARYKGRDVGKVKDHLRETSGSRCP